MRFSVRTKAWLAASLAAMLLGGTGCSSSLDLAAQEAPAEPPPIEAGAAPPPGPYAPGFDALHYEIALTLPEEGSFVEGRTTGRFLLTPPERDTLSLDFTGLAVLGVEAEGQEAGFQHDQGKLHVALPRGMRTGDTLDVMITYQGEPDDGLVLGRNIHGEPTAFADNWPNRARFWFPSIDHPSDKATVAFEVRLPEGSDRRVIANGIRLPSTDARIHRWAVDHPIPTYTMVVGAADHAVNTVGEACHDEVCTEVTTWLFPPDVEKGGPSFRRAAEMVEYYSDLIAPFPYSKLAHVQSATRFGGMENVSAIFYPEEPIHQGENIELTVAHETAHQWFGDAVTESDWNHLWLSEGFATYFAALFFEQAEGDGAFRRIMEGYRTSYLESEASSEPVINPDQDNLFELLNANNYSKGAWVLHMLRRKLGDDAFFGGIREYYSRHRHGTALTEDFRAAMESASGTSLEPFFDQWLLQPGHPQLQVTWSAADKQANVTVAQVHPASWPTFRFPLELVFETAAGAVRQTVEVEDREETFQFELSGEAADLRVDPDTDLLAEIVSTNRTSAE